jgi:hypothetical protein
MAKMIEQTFHDRFDKVFNKKDPTWDEIAEIFYWLKGEASCAREHTHLKMIDDLRRLAEARFSQIKHFRKKVDKESRRVNETQKKRDEQLRTIKLRRKGKVPLFGAEKEEERVPPSG